MIEKRTGRKIKLLQINSVGEYEDRFLWLGQNTGIGIHFTNRIYGVAKEINCSLLEKLLCLLSNAQLDKSFWAKVLVYASHLMNCLSLTAIEGKHY